MNEHEPQPEQQPQAAERPADTPPPRIWVGSLADYNAGRLHGQWLDAAQDSEQLRQQVQAMLSRSRTPGAEEYGIFDYDGFGGLRLDEYESLDVVARIANGIIEHGPAFAAWAQLHDADPGMLDHFEDAFCGAYDSREAWADTMLEDLNTEHALAKLPTWLQRHVHIDRTGMARDLELAGEVWIEDNPAGGIWVFDTRA